MGKKKGKNKKSKEVLGDGVTIKDESGNVISYISLEECREIVTDLYVKLFNAVQDRRVIEKVSE